MSIRTATIRPTVHRARRPHPFKGSNIYGTERQTSAVLSARSVLLTLLAILVISVTVWSHVSVKRVSERVELLELESKRLAAEHDALVAEEARLTRSQELAKVGRALGLRPPKDEEIVRLLQ
ncbi:MAG: hypothetical protein K6360_04050 [Deltaproteobacteria bacterium]